MDSDDNQDFSDSMDTDACSSNNKYEEGVNRRFFPKEKEDARVGKVFLPGQPLQNGETLEVDTSAYTVLYSPTTVFPSLTIDTVEVEENAADSKKKQFPLSLFVICGNQITDHKKAITLMKFSNIHGIHTEDSESESESESSDSEESDLESSDEERKGERAIIKENKQPKKSYIHYQYNGSINRIRTKIHGGVPLCAAWGDNCVIKIFNLQPQITSLNVEEKTPLSTNAYSRVRPMKELFTFSGHSTEGFAIDWSPVKSGVLATGDCRKDIHIWYPTEATWKVDQRPLLGHTASVEDIQWSPVEYNVLASCSVDKSIRIWDVRERPATACKLTVEDAHSSDVNVISWNRMEPFIVSGGDDGLLNVWDLRVFQKGKPLAKLKHHLAPVSTVEWHPTDSSVFASGGDDQIALWDLEAERDNDVTDADNELQNLPPQLLFIHQGQNELKELHWHKQIPNLIVSTDINGLNIFRTISV